ncbi:L,D-transpeptidase [Streptomyces cinerochromogenes]|uniref:L,D-transpeptidase n=1 Tax=Streptomyces cinerochromogenes TaxID=66422 RepID=UPI0033B8CABA
MSMTLAGRLRSTALALAAAAAFASALAAAPDGHAAPAEAGRAPVTTLEFVRNAGDPQNSRLTVLRDHRTVASYRAGSGFGAGHPKGRDECATARGWLPAGVYAVGARHTRYDGSVIKGYAIPLSDKTCNNGRTRRTALFIHSEMTRNGGQGRLESRRWDGPSDYRSNGCIKLAPGDIKKLFAVLADGSAPQRLRVV